VLPTSATANDFTTESANRRLKAVLASWSVERCREWLETEIGLGLGIEIASNKYFPLSNSSREVRDRLVAACEKAGVEFKYETSVDGVVRGSDGMGWTLRVRGSGDERARAIVLAMGGLSFPAVGTDGTGYAIARRDL
jgi:predicted flavoprotein YhiN